MYSEKLAKHIYGISLSKFEVQLCIVIKVTLWSNDKTSKQVKQFNDMYTQQRKIISTTITYIIRYTI